MLSPSSLGGNIAWLTACWPVIGFLCEPAVFGKSYQCNYFGQELKKKKAKKTNQKQTKKPTTKNHQPTQTLHDDIPGVNSAVSAQKLLLSTGLIWKRETWLWWHCDKLGVSGTTAALPQKESSSLLCPRSLGKKKIGTGHLLLLRSCLPGGLQGWSFGPGAPAQLRAPPGTKATAKA